MILKLIIKDIKAHKSTIFLRATLPMLIMSSIFNIQFYQWDVYLMISCMAISAAASTFLFFEKKRETEILTCSLPTIRSTIVIARYLTSIMISVVGIFLFYLNAYVAGFLYTNPVTQFWEINNLKVLFIALFFLSISMSVYLPGVFTFRLMGTVITFVISIIVSIIFVATIFKPGTASFMPYIEKGELAFLSIIIIFLPFISAILSAKIYNMKNL